MSGQQHEKIVLPKHDVLYHGSIGLLVKNTLQKYGTRLNDGTIVLRVTDTAKGLNVLLPGSLDYIFYGIHYFLLERLLGYDHVLVQIASSISTLTSMFRTRLSACGFNFYPAVINQSELWTMLLAFKKEDLMELNIRIYVMDMGVLKKGGGGGVEK